MNLLLSTKSGDVTAWRGAVDFATAYRQTLLDRAAYDRTSSIESVFSDASAALDATIAAHHNLMQNLNGLIESVASAAPTARLDELTAAFYNDLYRHFGQFRSAPAFFQLSMTFLRRTSDTVVAQALAQLGPAAGHLPELSLATVGPGGRCEYSPSCQLQLLLVFDTASLEQLQDIDRFCQALHNGFEAAGVPLDPVITPRNPEWRGTLAQWQQRCEEGLHQQVDEELINLFRLVDLLPLQETDRLAMELRRISRSTLGNSHVALTNLIKRVASLSNGIGLMGGLKLERSGNDRGLFRLLDHGLLPFSAALSTLALINGSTAVGTSERINDMLKQRQLDVDMAERMLATWQTLQGLRLQQELSSHTPGQTKHSLCLDPDELTIEELDLLKETLESVALIQRYVEIVFSGMGE